ncbi:hypothetical protein [Corynebacterium uterequi]|uniref:DUF559 domain-containing protein n=1 Tax=Corynebacterium uterequi TaxID=1072256 RepID=A0A0G3HE34_9CORY|nr:hypothetical protein [Corynebacterium uterequi]AKK10995.1 hypothetical protein CUTER_04970 [Corynebacterium uterequi]
MATYTTEQLRDQGISKYRTARLIAGKQLFRLIRGLYVDRYTPEEVARAITTAYPDAVLTGESAAALHLGLPLTFPIRAEGARTIRGLGFSITHSRGPSRTSVDGIAVVEPLWAAVKTPRLAQRLVEKHYSGKGARRRLNVDLARMGRIPRWLRSAVERTPIGARSKLESNMAKELIAEGFAVRLNEYVGPYCYDILLKRWRIAIEIDSHKYHLDSDSFVSDRWKSNSGMVHGWLVLRFTDSCLRWNLHAVISAVKQAVAWVRARRPLRNWHPGYPAGQSAWEWNHSLM